MLGVDSNRWGKLDMDDEKQWKFDLLHKRKSVDFSGITDDFCTDFCFQRKQEGELHGNRGIGGNQVRFRKEKESLR